MQGALASDQRKHCRSVFSSTQQVSSDGIGVYRVGVDLVDASNSLISVKKFIKLPGHSISLSLISLSLINEAWSELSHPHEVYPSPR